MALKITITDAGRAALINADHSGTRLVSISSVGISATAITADKSATNLADEIKRLTTISGKITASDAIHLIAKDDGSDVYTIKSFALYLDDGTLFAIYGQPSPILEKSAAAMLLLQLDIRFADIDATQIQFGNLDFINPAATEKTAGITRLTALGEAEQSTENIAVSPVELRRYAEKLARQADMIAALATKFDKTGGTVDGFVNAKAFNSGAFYANDKKIDLVHGGRHCAFQEDGNTVFYGADGVAKTSIGDGLIWANRSITSDDNINAAGMVHVRSWNSQNGLDMHSDDDGIVRMYAKNLWSGGYQQFLSYKPNDGNLDLTSRTGALFINGSRCFAQNFMGSGSGLDAEFWRGMSPDIFFKTGGSTFTGDSYVNGWAFYCSNNGSKARMNFETQDHIAFWNNADHLAAWFDLSGDNKSLHVNDLVTANHVYTPALDAYADHVDINYGQRRCSFQTDGNNVFYGVDGTTETSLLDGNFWTRGSISTQNNVNATGMVHVQSRNGQNGLDMHSDDDGFVRMFAENLWSGGYQQFLSYKPNDGNLDLTSRTGALFINGSRCFAQNFMGSGSGLDAEFWRGMSPDHFAANSRIETSGVSNGLMKRIDDHVELHLKLDNVVGVISLPYTFNNIVDIQITTFRDTDSRPVWANVISYTNNTITVSGNYMAHGNNQNADSCAGFIHVYGN